MQDLGPSVRYLKYRVNLTLQPEAHNLQMQLSQNLHSKEKNDLQQFQMESDQPIKRLKCRAHWGVGLVFRHLSPDGHGGERERKMLEVGGRRILSPRF